MNTKSGIIGKNRLIRGVYEKVNKTNIALRVTLIQTNFQKNK